MVEKQPESETEPLEPELLDPEPLVPEAKIPESMDKPLESADKPLESTDKPPDSMVKPLESDKTITRVPSHLDEVYMKAQKKVEDADSAQDLPDKVAKKVQELSKTVKYTKQTQDKINVKETQEMGKE